MGSILARGTTHGSPEDSAKMCKVVEAATKRDLSDTNCLECWVCESEPAMLDSPSQQIAPEAESVELKQAADVTSAHTGGGRSLLKVQTWFPEMRSNVLFDPRQDDCLMRAHLRMLAQLFGENTGEQVERHIGNGLTLR